MSKCNCDAEPIEKDNGEWVCSGCGVVVDQRDLVNTVMFGENADGSARMQGRIVGIEGHSMSYDSNLRIGGRSNYKEQMLEEARTKMRGAARALDIPEAYVDIGLRTLRIYSNVGLTTGRQLDVTIAVCLYIACRTQKKSPCVHMLIDFSDVFQINVFTLGKFYQFVCRRLSIETSVVEPSTLIMRYASKLDFGEYKEEVSNTAIRVVKRMQKDWIAYGRRPSGICGAALILAGRTYGFHMKPSDIVSVVKIGSDTIKKRMKEFGKTDSSKLSIKKFMEMDIMKAHDPPSFNDKKRLEDHELAEIEENSRQIDQSVKLLHP